MAVTHPSGNFVSKHKEMTHEYQLQGMTCDSCVAKVKSSLLVVPHITGVEVSRKDNKVVLQMDQHVGTNMLQKALDSKYTISGADQMAAEPTENWLTTYKPLLLVFFYITGIALITGYQHGQMYWMRFMDSFMAGFFLSFSFFKLLNLAAFADSYAGYDIIAKRWRGWGYLYAFIELGLGLAYATHFEPILTNSVSFVVMGVSIIGVLQSLVNKRKIQCACLGTVFNLPMSTVTVIEDALMMVMSGTMLVLLNQHS
jgi:copper chaperone CopZ